MGRVTNISCSLLREEREGQTAENILIRDISSIKVRRSAHTPPHEATIVGVIETSAVMVFAGLLVVFMSLGRVLSDLVCNATHKDTSVLFFPVFLLGLWLWMLESDLTKRIILAFDLKGKKRSVKSYRRGFQDFGPKCESLSDLSNALTRTMEEYERKSTRIPLR